MTTKDDSNVEQFFAQMKQLDNQMRTPDLMDKITRRRRLRRRRIYYSIAASVTILIVALLMTGSEPSSQEIDIAVVEQDLESMMSWQSATGSLMETK